MKNLNKRRFFRKKLENGMTVIFEQRKGSGVASVLFAVKHGGIHESSKEKGISHFIEHMLYKGTPNRTARQISEQIERNGGILNGFTDEEFTAFLAKIPSDKIDIALEVLADMIKNSLFDESELNKERKVIIEEIKMRKDRPDIYVVDKIQGMLYSGNLSQDAIGTEETLGSIDKQKIVKKFKDVYNAGNLVLCVVGDSNFQKLCSFCNKTFLKSRSEIKEPVIGLRNGRRIDKRAGLDQANLVFAFHSFPSGNKENYVAQVLSGLMAGGMSSRLFQEIREKRNLAYVVKGACSSGKRYGYNYVFVGTKKEHLKEVINLILREFEKLKDLTEKELEDIKAHLIGNSKISREDSHGQMLDLIYNEIWDKAENSYKYEEEIRKVKLEDVKKLALSVHEGNYSLLALVPA